MQAGKIRATMADLPSNGVSNLSWGETKRRLIAANQEILSDLVSEAQGFIQRTYVEHHDREVFTSFSGGKDSVVVAWLVTEALEGFGVTVPLFFADTTIELPDTYAYVDRMRQYFEIIVEKTDNDFYELCDILDPPSRIIRWCCSLCKAYPLNKFLNRLTNDILAFDGIRRSESNSRRDYPRIFQNPKAKRQLAARPILHWPTLAVWLYIFDKGIPYNPAYLKGFGRVGCLHCPSNSNYDDLLVKTYYPRHYEKMAALLSKFAVDNDKGDPQEFIEKEYWKRRKPASNDRITVQVTEIRPNSFLYTFTKPIPREVTEFLKIIGDIRIGINTFRTCTTNPMMIRGNVGGSELLVDLPEKRTYTRRKQVERQIEKALNCIACGGCLGKCPNGALSISSSPTGARRLVIDQNKCSHCLKCNTLRNCVVMSHKSGRVRIGQVSQ